MKKFRIAVIGIGGVGGYIGGKLALKYSSSNLFEIIFIARGENLEAIFKNGLKLITKNGEQICVPSLVSDDIAKIGTIDLLISCIKNYDLEQTFHKLSPCITEHSIILPLENGLDSSERIKSWFPLARVWQGCIYLVSRLLSPGVVVQNGELNQLYFGSYGENLEDLKNVENILKTAGINVESKNNISQILWEKFIFISPLGTLTSYLNICVGDIIHNDEFKNLLIQLMKEIELIASGMNIILPKDIIKKNLGKLRTMPRESTSSMHDDFKKGNKTEVQSLAGYVVQKGKELNLPTPNYEKMFHYLIHL